MLTKRQYTHMQMKSQNAQISLMGGHIQMISVGKSEFVYCEEDIIEDIEEVLKLQQQ